MSTAAVANAMGVVQGELDAPAGAREAAPPVLRSAQRSGRSTSATPPASAASNDWAVAEVAVGLPVRGTYHYRVPAGSAGVARVGARVLVPFGGRGVTGVIVRQGASEETPADLREIREVLDAVPALDEALVELCLWIAEYYEAPPGEVLRAALPAGTQVGSAAKVCLTDAGRAALAGESTGALPAATRRTLARFAAVATARGNGAIVWKGGSRELAPLLEAGLVERIDERTAQRVKARTQSIVKIARAIGEDDRASLSRAKKRLEVLAALEAEGGALPAAELARRVPGAAAAVKALVDAGLCVKETREVLRDVWNAAAPGTSAPIDPLPPTPDQAAALATLRAAVEAGAFQSLLLHGVTGSGKTEVYLQTIAAALARGRGALVLVPEIALTPQLAARFRARFGDRVAVLHSGLSDGERYDQWRRLRAGEARIALGARSAVFAPVAELGVIVVDEEHDPSFKQEEGVRYHARDVALRRAQRAGAVCLLGSATPSLESYANARAGRFGLLELRQRPTERPLPEVEIVDLKTWAADGESMLTAPLAAAIEATLAAGEQAVLFLNRRGFATFVVCVGCGHSFRCAHCSVSLKYHRERERLACHYCGHTEHVPDECPKCRARSIQRLGLGTERIEAAVRVRFPKARVARLDRDTASGPGLRAVLARVAAREVDILVGTQMVTKGHDFPGVTLVGVLCADTGLSLPDFRATERTFQLLTQVAGRAGRGDRPGRVIIQTWRPDHPALVHAKNHDYASFYAAEVADRAEVAWPPHGRVITLRIDGEEDGAVQWCAQELGRHAHAAAGDDGVTINGPCEAALKRLKGRTRWQLVLCGRERVRLRSLARRLVSTVQPPRGVRVTVDVDPMSSL